MSHSAEAEGAGLLARVRSLVGGLLEIIETRLELFGADIELQAERLRRVAVLLLAGLLFLALALVFGSVLVIAAVWDTYRLAAIAAVGAVHLAAGSGVCSGCGTRARRTAPFDATIAELRQTSRGC